MKHKLILSKVLDKRFLSYGFILFLCLSSFETMAAIAGDQAGVFVNGSIRSLFLICTTCPPAAEVDDQQNAGRFGDNGPAIVNGADDRGTATANYSARAIIFGADLLPQLKAVASSSPGVGTHDGFSGTGAYFLQTSADAKAIQYYTYHGSVPATYTISYVIDGDVQSDRPETAPQVTVSGGMALFDDGDKLGGELPMGHVIDFNQKTFDGNTHGFLDGGTLSINVDPGNSFYLSAFLSAGVTGQAGGFADVGHTFNASFTGGDTSLLTGLLPASPVVTIPIPPSLGMMVLGLATLLSIAQDRKSVNLY